MEQGLRIKTLILICLLLSGVLRIHSQSAGDIDTLSQWRINETWGSHLYIQYDYFKYYISGTIDINSQTYFKVYRSGYYHINNDPNVHYNSYFAPLRVENNKWYTVDIDENDVILYDFTLNVGDTVTSFANYSGDLITVTAIDTILIDGESKKRFFLGDNYGTEYIIEDIGANTGLFEPLTWFDNWSMLRCFAIDFVPLWQNPESGSCDLSVGISEIQKEYEIYIYPNPFTTSTTLSYTLDKPSAVTISILNPQGQLIEQIIQEQPKGEQQVQWNAAGLPDGMYYFRIQAGDKVGGGKMLKM